jgi:hypothetical protein
MPHRLLLCIAILTLMGLYYATPTQYTVAQNPYQALTHYAVTAYSGPGRTYAIVGVLNPKAKVILEARDTGTSWLLGRSMDGTVRGWIEKRFLDLPADSSLIELRVSQESMFVPEPTEVDYRTINLDQYPVIPTNLGRARDIFETGHSLGMESHTVSKIGDCISDNRNFLSPFGWGEYNLGIYDHLQSVISFFSVSLSYDSLAAYDGLVTSAVLDPIFSNPLACEPGETPLRCEYRVHRPSLAIIMFGAQDLLFTQPADFDRNLRQIIHESIQVGVIPILSTFPGNTELWQNSILYNQIVVQVALDYDVPLMNLWRALYPLPNHGLNVDGRHLSLPITYSGDLSQPNLQRGYPQRNLVALQALDAVWRGTMN